MKKSEHSFSSHFGASIAPTVELFGNTDEAFYQLGLKDSENGKIVHQSIHEMLKTPITSINKLSVELGQRIIENTHFKDKSKYPHLVAYAEGMSVDPSRLYYTMLVPELVSCMSKWAPGTVKSQFGCSSIFSINEQDDLIHTRILDFPLQNTYDCFERSILYSLKDYPKTFAFNTAGVPYPSITAITESGMSIALHQKFTNIMNLKGESIFEIIFELIKKVDNKKDAIDFLKSKKSFTTWCLYLSFKNQDILAYDIMGDNAYYKEYHRDDLKNGPMYFCNHLEDKTLNQTHFLPLGFNEYNCLRENVANLKLKELAKKNHYSEVDLLKSTSSPYHLKNKTLLKIDNITATSILSTVMNPNAQIIHYIPGLAPKIYQGEIIKVDKCFTSPNHQQIKEKKYTDQNKSYYQGLRALTNAQHAFNNSHSENLYHELQMAIDHLELYPEIYIAKFYFLIAQFLYETHPKVHANLIIELKKIAPHLSPYLKEHCLLFIFRLEYLLNLPISIELDEIKTQKLKDIYNLELKIPRPIFHFTIKFLIVPRIDILDVIYVHTH